MWSHILFEIRSHRSLVVGITWKRALEFVVLFELYYFFIFSGSLLLERNFVFNIVLSVLVVGSF